MTMGDRIIPTRPRRREPQVPEDRTEVPPGGAADTATALPARPDRQPVGEPVALPAQPDPRSAGEPVVVPTC